MVSQNIYLTTQDKNPTDCQSSPIPPYSTYTTQNPHYYTFCVPTCIYNPPKKSMYLIIYSLACFPSELKVLRGEQHMIYIMLKQKIFFYEVVSIW